MNRSVKIAACAACVTGAVAAAYLTKTRPGPAAATAAPAAAHVAVAPTAAVLASETKAIISARPVAVSETRERAIGDAAKGGGGFFTGLRVKLRLDGPGAKEAAKVGRLKVLEAVDDTGADLRDKEQLKWCEQLQDVNRFGMGDATKSSGAFEYELRLGLPARRATSISRMKAELLVLTGGQEKVASVPAARKLAGQTLEDPALKAAGVNVKIAANQVKEDSLAVELSGDFDAIREVKVLAPDGKNVLTGTWWTESGGKRSVSYMLSRPVSDSDIKLEIRLVAGQKKLAVPVELADIPLP